jgi:small subunit ribosomal protein S13
MTTRRAAAVFEFANHESTTISKKVLCELQDCETQERGACDLQKSAAQATPGLITAVIKHSLMPRLLGVEIPADKRVEVSLTYIYGVGFSTARRILEQTNIDPNIRAKDLTPQQLNEIIHAITNNKIKIEGDLRRDVQGNLKRLQAINSYRGIRHRKGLPVRGQRTSTNARTRKGPRKTVGVIRNPDAKAGKV